MAFVSIDQLLGKITSLMFFNFLKEEALIPISGNDGAPIYCPIEHHEYWYALNGLGKYEGMSPQERKAIWTQIGEDDDILSPRDEAKRTNRRENGGSWRYLHIHTQEDPEHILQHVRGEAKEQGNKLIAFLKAHNAYFDEHGVRRILNETGRVEGKYGPDWQYVRNLTLEEFLHGPIPDFTDSGTCPADKPLDPKRLTREALTEKIEKIRGFELRRLEEERASWDVKTAITVAEAAQKRSILRELDSQIANVKDAPLEAFVTAPFGTEDAFFSVQKQLLGLEPCSVTAKTLAKPEKSMPSKADTNWDRVRHKVADIAPEGITKEKAYSDPLVQSLMKEIWGKRIPKFSYFAKNVKNVPVLKTGRPRNK